MSDVPRFMTIRECAQAGPLGEYTLRQLAKQNRLPCIYSGKKCLINYDRLLEKLNSLDGLGM